MCTNLAPCLTAYVRYQYVSLLVSKFLTFRTNIYTFSNILTASASADRSTNDLTGHKNRKARWCDQGQTPPAWDELERERLSPLTPLSPFTPLPYFSFALSQYLNAAMVIEKKKEKERENGW
jgi:hypothetical protein